MNALQRFLHKSQKMFLRRCAFQIHLWAGVILALYVAVVGISGSILVFREELTAWVQGDLLKARNAGPSMATVPEVIDAALSASPGAHVDGLYLPSLYSENFRVFVSGKPPKIVYVDAASATVVGQSPRVIPWIAWLQQLHFYLFLGRPGLIINGVGGLLLMLLCATGIWLWWPGVKRWKRALGVKWSAGWKRVNWDLHSAVGFWLLPWVVIWGLTGAYFAWPLLFAQVVNTVSPVSPAMLPPRCVVKAPAPADSPWPIAALLTRAKEANPETRLAAIQFPARPTAPLVILMSRGELWDTRSCNYVYLDPYRGDILATWYRGVNRSAGEAFVFLMGPLHFGVYWGMTVKILWAVFGLSLPLLAITGVLMYWNRYLGKKWKQWTGERVSSSNADDADHLSGAAVARMPVD